MSDRLARLGGIFGFAVRRTLSRLGGGERTQILLSVGGVAVAVALMLLVTSVGVGLSASETVRASNADYAIIPSGGSSATLDVGRAGLGGAHSVVDDLAGREGIASATAVRIDSLQVAPNATPPPDNDSVTLLVVGVAPAREGGVVAGIPTGALEPGDPHYANGTYEGPFTGETVLSPAAADRLNATRGTTLRPGGTSRPGGADRTLRVTAIRQPRAPGVGQFPVALVHLSELQTLLNDTTGDPFDQLLVETEPGATDVEATLAGVYPTGTTVVSRDDLFAGAGGRSRLPAAIALAAFVVSLVVGTLFVITTMGFELAADRERRAVMRAIGLSGASRTAIVVVQTFVVAVAGGVAGIGLWLAGIAVTNTLAGSVSGVPIAAFRPVLAAYGLGVAVLIGLLTVPYLLLAARRGSTSEVTL